MKQITIVGGGSSAYMLIATLSKTDYKINMLTSRPLDWKKNIAVEYIGENGQLVKTFSGVLNKITSNPHEVIPFSEIIFLCMPVHKYRIALDNIGEFINNNQKIFIGTVYGQAGFNWMVNEIKAKYHLSNIITFAIGLIPWICRIKKYGEIGITYGPKNFNVVAVDTFEDFSYLNKEIFNYLSLNFFNTGGFHYTNSFISLTLSVDNQIIHTSRLYDLAMKSGGKWSKIDEVPYFYRNFTNSSASMLKKIDKEYQKIRNKIRKLYIEKDFRYMLDYIKLERLSYDSRNVNILQSFLNSKTLGQIKTPVKFDENKNMYIIDKKHRFFFDDINFGLLIAKWFAEQLNIKVPNINKILYWAQDLMNDIFLVNDQLVVNEISFKYGIPSVYGFKSIDDCID